MNKVPLIQDLIFIAIKAIERMWNINSFSHLYKTDTVLSNIYYTALIYMNKPAKKVISSATQPSM